MVRCCPRLWSSLDVGFTGQCVPQPQGSRTSRLASAARQHLRAPHTRPSGRMHSTYHRPIPSSVTFTLSTKKKKALARRTPQPPPAALVCYRYEETLRRNHKEARMGRGERMGRTGRGVKVAVRQEHIQPACDLCSGRAQPAAGAGSGTQQQPNLTCAHAAAGHRRATGAEAAGRGGRKRSTSEHPRAARAHTRRHGSVIQGR